VHYLTTRFVFLSSTEKPDRVFDQDEGLQEGSNENRSLKTLLGKWVRSDSSHSRRIPGTGMKRDRIRRSGVRVAAVILLLTIGLVGCGPPPAVRSLSQEQLSVQEAFATTLAEYFEVIEGFAEAQMQLATFLLDEIDLEIRELYTARALSAMEQAGDSNAHREALDELARNVQQESDTTATAKVQIAALVQQLRESHQTIQVHYLAIIEAQRKLNEYIQLQRVDEMAANQLAGLVGMNLQQIRQEVDAITREVADIVTMADRTRQLIALIRE
jgi:hypothetical protein